MSSIKKKKKGKHLLNAVINHSRNITKSPHVDTPNTLLSISGMAYMTKAVPMDVSHGHQLSWTYLL